MRPLVPVFIAALVIGSACSSSGAMTEAARRSAALTPSAIYPPDGATFDYYPRLLELRWSAVPGAVRYRVEVEHYASTREGISWRWYPVTSEEVPASSGENSLEIRFLGAQPGRWRVTAIDEIGTILGTSPWSEFTFTR